MIGYRRGSRLGTAAVTSAAFVMAAAIAPASGSGKSSADAADGPDFSAPGRYEAVTAPTSSPTAGGVNAAADVFVRDRLTGASRRLSVGSGGEPADGSSFEAAISADGRYVVFTSSASNLVAGDTNSATDVFLHELSTGTTRRVSLGPSGRQADGDSFSPAVSADGRYVAFYSQASNLAPGDGTGTLDVFVRDVVAGSTRREPVPTGSRQPDDESASLKLSADGRLVGLSPGAAAFRYKDGFASKVYPSRLDRAARCTTRASTLAPISPVLGRTVTYQRPRSLASVSYDNETIPRLGIVPDDFKMTLIVVRRVAGVPHYRYLSNNTHQTSFQPWSTTKYLAVANAAARLRLTSNARLGLGARVESSSVPFGDVVTNIASYQIVSPSSNGLGRYMHDIGGRARANAMIHEGWLGRPPAETFGGNYGQPAPDWGYAFVNSFTRLVIRPDTTTGPGNYLSTVTLAESLKRLVMHREDVSTRLPNFAEPDRQILFYGSGSASAWFRNQRWGGLSADKAIYLQSALDIPKVEQASKGTWRIFSKVGYGAGDFVSVGYVCAAHIDTKGAPVTDSGKEFVLAARLATGGSTDQQRDALFATYHRRIIEKVLDGTIS
jgi:hypothetical protein